jgi:hypothetical protein
LIGLSKTKSGLVIFIDPARFWLGKLSNMFDGGKIHKMALHRVARLVGRLDN